MYKQVNTKHSFIAKTMFRRDFRLTDSRREWRLIFRQVLVRGLLEWMCLSSLWKKFTLSWKVSDPPANTFNKVNTTTIWMCDEFTNNMTHTYQCSCEETVWRWQPWYSCPYSWALLEAESHHPLPASSTCVQGLAHGMWTVEDNRKKEIRTISGRIHVFSRHEKKHKIRNTKSTWIISRKRMNKIRCISQCNHYNKHLCDLILRIIKCYNQL